jgi:hypothetical protein
MKKTILLCGAAALGLVPSSGLAAGDDNEEPPAPSTSVSQKATFLVSNERWHSDPKVGWDGFLSGLRGFEHFHNPVGQPIYFEPALNFTGAKFIYVHHTISDDSTVAGGDVNVAALSLRVALTERLGLIAVKDGYSWLNVGALPEDEGWNELGAGLKYLFIVDREHDFTLAGGARLMLDSGEDKVAQFGTPEVSPFVSFAKGWGRFHLLGSLTYRIPFDGDDGNQVFMWDLHADWEAIPETLPGLAPMIELHGVHYTTDGERLALDVGGLDYANFGSNDVAGSSVVWAGFGARWKFNPHLSIGAVYEIGLTDHDEDLMRDRVTVDFEVLW